MQIIEVAEITDAIEAAFQRLMPQLSPKAVVPTRVHLMNLIASNACTLLLAVDGAAVLGTLTMAVYPIPSGTRVWIEDVVVDDAARGRGVGEALLQEAIRRARGLGVSHIDLTSSPWREAANRLYVRLGFVPRDTNAYRLLL